LGKILRLFCKVTRKNNLPAQGRLLPALRFKSNSALKSACRHLTLDIQQFLQHMVGSGNRPGVGLVTALGGDHAGKLVSQIHVGHL